MTDATAQKVSPPSPETSQPERTLDSGLLSTRTLTTQTITSCRIPLEIAERIIDELRGVDMHSLTVCALTCKSFLKRAQRNIFHSLISWDAKRMYLPFVDAIIRNPELALYVKELRITDDVSMEDDMHLKHPSFPIVLGMFKNLTTFNLFVLQDPYEFGWNQFTHEVQNALAFLFQSHSISSLTLTTVLDLPPIVTEWFLHIPFVKIDGITFDKYSRWLPNNNAREDRHDFNLKTLQIFTQFSLRSSYDLTPIRPLFKILSSEDCKLETLIAGFSELDVAQTIIQKAPTTLTTFECQIGISDADWEVDDIPIDSSIFARLKIVKFLVACHRDIFMKTMISILSKVSHDNTIREIAIELSFCHSDWEEQCNWEVLDNLFSGSPFTKLQKAAFYASFVDDVDGVEFEGRIRNLLPNTNITRPLQISMVGRPILADLP